MNGGYGSGGFRAAQRGRGEVRLSMRLGHPEQAAACALGCAVTASRIVPVVASRGQRGLAVDRWRFLRGAC